MTVVAPSRWLQSAAQASSLFRNKRVINIPTGVNERVFKPVDKKWARRTLNLDENSFIVLFGASNAINTGYKGFSFFESVANSNQNNQTVFLVFGSAKNEINSQSNSRIQVLGMMQDEVSMALIYNAADVFVAPYADENLPNTILESMACGTPCLAFNSGGIPEVIDHMIDGILTPDHTAESIANGIELLRNDYELRKRLSDAARKKIETAFTASLQAERYIQLCKEVAHV